MRSQTEIITIIIIKILYGGYTIASCRTDVRQRPFGAQPHNIVLLLCIYVMSSFFSLFFFLLFFIIITSKNINVRQYRYKIVHVQIRRRRITKNKPSQRESTRPPRWMATSFDSVCCLLILVCGYVFIVFAMESSICSLIYSHAILLLYGKMLLLLHTQTLIRLH